MAEGRDWTENIFALDAWDNNITQSNQEHTYQLKNENSVENPSKEKEATEKQNGIIDKITPLKVKLRQCEEDLEEATHIATRALMKVEEMIHNKNAGVDEKDLLLDDSFDNESRSIVLLEKKATKLCVDASKLYKVISYPNCAKCWRLMCFLMIKEKTSYFFITKNVY